MSSKAPNRVPDVSTLPCQAMKVLAGENAHRIENVEGGRGAECIGCGVSWADLDERLRVTLPNRGHDPV